METFFTITYPLVGLISFMAFFPQMILLLKATSSPKNVSIKSWMFYAVGTFLSSGYGIFCLHDLAFTLISLLCLSMNLIMVCLIIRNRYIKFGHAKQFSEALLLCFIKEPFEKYNLYICKLFQEYRLHT